MNHNYSTQTNENTLTRFLGNQITETAGNMTQLTETSTQPAINVTQTTGTNHSAVPVWVEDFTGEYLPTWARGVFGTLHLLTSINGVLGSVLILTTLRKAKHFRKPNCTYSVYMGNLVVTDLWFQLYFFPSLVIGYGVGRYPTVDIRHCQVLGFISLTCYSVFVLTLTAISFDRYMRVCHDGCHRKHFTWRTSAGVVVLIWMVGAMVPMPGAVQGYLGFDAKTHTCFVSKNAPPSVSMPYVLVFIFSILASAFFNIRIYLVYKAVRRRVAQHADGMRRITTELQLDVINGVTVNKKVTSSDMALLRSLTVIFSCLVVFVTPGSVARALRHKYDIPGVLYALFLWMLSINSSIDWIVYGFLNTKFRSGYRKILAKCLPCLRKGAGGSSDVTSLPNGTNCSQDCRRMIQT